ncbi:hypothetical protein VE03_09423 [Pseudogymnoascus sp. 23342-1-I1]|nr:hypothetical protein VE03_09423 [Pseudogymnoascus sp. 23342-1-I1]
MSYHPPQTTSELPHPSSPTLSSCSWASSMLPPPSRDASPPPGPNAQTSLEEREAALKKAQEELIREKAELACEWVLWEHEKETNHLDRKNNDVTRNNNDRDRKTNDLARNNNDRDRKTNDLARNNNDRDRRNNATTRSELEREKAQLAAQKRCNVRANSCNENLEDWQVAIMVVVGLVLCVIPAIFILWTTVVMEVVLCLRVSDWVLGFRNLCGATVDV